MVRAFGRYWRVLFVTVVCGVLACGSTTKEFNNFGYACEYTEKFKIIGGSQCNQQPGPVVKLILLDDEENPKTCSGILISPTKILTAGHCFDEYIFSAYAEIDGVRAEVKDSKVNEKAEALEGGEIKNDFAIVELQKPFNGAKIISQTSQIEPKKGDKVEIYGYGKDTFEPVVTTLRRAEMIVENVNSDFITTVKGPKNQTTCFGDSGGPAFLVTEAGLELIGILTSGTNQDCDKADKSIFVNLTKRDLKKLF